MNFYNLSDVFFIFLLLNLTEILCSKLNVPRVLLPYSHDEYPSNFTLKVYEDGCYKWTSTRDEVAIEEIYSNNGCSKQAMVSAISRSSSRLTAIVLAKDIDTGISLRCDVIIDAIESLQIVTTTRELYAEEAPEEFEVRAYDLHGNEFSSLEGQKFSWDLQTITDYEAVIPAQTVLRFITFEASPYETPPSIASLEARGEQGYMVLIEGRQTGLARLSVRLSHPSYKKLTPASVDLMVIANLILEPQDTYMLPHTSILYSVMHLKQGIFHPVDIQGSQYFLQVVDDGIGRLEEDGIHVTALMHGNTQVILRDNHVKSSQTLKQPTANFHVVEPSYLTITIQPGNNPSLVVDNHYNFVVNLFDKSNHRINIADNVIVDTFVSEEYFSSEFISKNGTFITATPTKTGSTKITAKLTSIQISGDQVVELSPHLMASQTVDIFHKISVIPKLSFFPWDPVRKPSYKVNLMVDRYNDSVSWISSKNELLSVNRLGNCKTNGKGIATVTASLNANPHNKDSAQIIVAEALELHVLGSEVEVEVDSMVYLPIALSTLYKESEFYFTVCNQLPIIVTPDQHSFVAFPDLEEGNVVNSCAEAKLQSKRSGFSTVTVSYSSSAGKLENEAIIAAFYPLKPISPSSASTVLALETSRTVVFEGGPLPWTKKPSNHFAEVNVTQADAINAHLIHPRTPNSRTDIYAVYVECHELGTFTLSLTVGNRPSATLPFPKIVSSSVTVICAVPEALNLRSLLASSSSCPGFNGPDMSIGHCQKTIPIEAEIQDGEGHKFDNASSLDLNWLISDKSLASFLTHELKSSKASELYGFTIPHHYDREVQPHGLPGDFVVTVEMNGYKESSMQHHNLPSLQDSLQIHLVEDASLQPSNLVLFNQDEIQEEIKVIGGSGYFHLLNEKSQVASLRYLPLEQAVLVSPLSDGNMTLTLQDLCLPGVSPINSSIRVSSISSIGLKMIERVEVGSSIIAEGVVYDIDGNIIPANSLMHLRPHSQSDIISITYSGISHDGNALYDVKGLIAGDTTIKLSSQKSSSDAPLYSNSVNLQVFPPLKIFPRNITLIVGAVFQVETRGGPYPNSAIEFKIINETVASTTYTGIVTAMTLGSSQILAKSVMVTKDQQLMVISQDTVTIHVVPMDVIRIHSPLRHIETGATMPLFVIGSDSLSPLSYGTANPPLIFDWSVSNEQVAVLQNAYEQNGIAESKENLGIIRLHAIKPGRVTITVKVKVSVPQSLQKYQTKDNLILIDKIEIKVFESLRLKSPMSDDARILLSPNSQSRIITNRNKEGSLSYAVDCQNKQLSSPLIEVAEGLVTANSDIGEASVLITVEKPFGVTQSLAVGVEVRTINYFLAVPEVFMEPIKYSFVGSLPLGITHTVKIQFHDNRGRIFTSANAEIEYRLSRFDIVNVLPGPTNDTFTITVRDIGQTVLHVLLKDNPLISDYIKINSGPGIIPHKISVPLGGSVCFSSYLRGPNETNGVWSSESSGFEIDPNTGVGVSHQIGKFTITYQVTSTIVTTTEIQVVSINKISVDPGHITMSNVAGSASWFIPVSLLGEGVSGPLSHCATTELLHPEIPFKCKMAFDSHSETAINVNHLFAIAPAYAHDKGFGCDVRSITGPDLLLSNLDLKLSIECIVPPRGPQKEIRSGTTAVNFLPAVVPDKTEVYLSNEEYANEVILHGKEEVLTSFIISEEPRNINVALEAVDKFSSRLTFLAKEVLLSRCSASESYKASLTSVLTHQVIELTVNFNKVGSDTCEQQEVSKGIFGKTLKWITYYQGHVIFLLCVFVAFICLIYGYQGITSNGYKQTQNQTVFASNSTQPFCTTGLTGSPCGTDCQGLKKRLVFSTTPRSSVPLWSDDKEPVYGDPLFRSSPRPAYDGSPTYSSFS